MKARAFPRAWDGRDEETEFRRWLMAAVVVFAAHLIATLAILYWPKPVKSAGDAPPAILVELAPLAVAPESEHLDVAPGPEMVEAQPKQEPEPKPEEKTPAPELPQKAESEVVLPPPAPEKKEEEKPQPQPQKAVQQRKDLQKHYAPQTTAAPKLNLKKAAQPAATVSGTTADSVLANANWRGAVVAHLNRFKRFPGGASGGTAVVAFSIDPGGRVTSARLVRSSGSSALDADAVAMIWRASPVPAPPASVSRGAGISLSVPVRYVR